MRWLALFRDFLAVGGANWGQACLAYLYLCLDTLSQGNLHQLVGPWKLLEVSLFLSFLIALVHAKENYNPCSCKLFSYSLCALQTIILQTVFTCTLYSCKLYSFVHYNSCKLYSLLHYILANCLPSFFFLTLGCSIWSYCSKAKPQP